MGASDQDFDKAIEFDPKDAGLYEERGKALDMSGQTLQAIEAFSRALEVDPEDAEAFKLRGLAERKLGREAAAPVDLEKYNSSIQTM